VRTADADLVDRCLRGEFDAFETLYRRESGRLFAMAYRMCGSATDAEDLLQEIFLTAFRKLGQFKGDSALSTWLYRLGVNHCLDFLRSRAHKMQQSSESLDNDQGGAPVLSTRTTPARSVDRLDLERAIAALPPGCKAAFVLHDVEGFQHDEIAEMLEIATGTSKSQVHKARLKIRVFLSRVKAPALVLRNTAP
jgi:RNA polymerase sigma-70 factor (ECF subfamily)